MTASISCHYAGTSGARHAIVQIRHDGKLNAMSRAMWRELRTVFLQLQQETTVPDPLRCVMVQGVDGHFCAGGDISEYQSFRFDPESLRLFHEEEVWGGLSAMLACDAPLIAAIDGNCMGAGVEISSCCDIRIATVSSRYGAPIAKLGFPMAPQEAVLVAGTLGATLARSMLLEAGIYPADVLLQRGFLTRTVPDAAALESEVSRTVERILRLSPSAARLHKQMMREWSAVHQPVLERQSATAFDYADHPEHREGIQAFLDKRPARF